MSGTARGEVDFVGHVQIPVGEIEGGTPINNFIFRAKTNEGKWIEEATTSIGDWRARFRSTYIRWSLAINGLHVAAEKYDDWQGDKGFIVRSIRTDKDGNPDTVTIALWDGPTASANHRNTIPMLVAYGIIDLYAVLEEFVFDVYRTYLNSHQEVLLRGEEFKELRRLRREAATNPERQSEWNEKWSDRLNSWQRKRIYDGIEDVFLAFFQITGLKKPKNYVHTDETTWASSLRVVAVLRNLLIHGASTVNSELSELCKNPYALGFDFKEGEPLELDLLDLMSVECFTDALVSGMNLSLCEHPDAGK